ncbi:SMI1/KNR4 family protein [Nonomuraea sp. NPDC026600]|uniref:SMI1/KNR4 family protein n=1 Tax=Nonomuraea sp. NPDC026600 TaxID=3155363 RepID=UPI0033EBC328
MEWLAAHSQADKLTVGSPAVSESIAGIEDAIGRPVPEALAQLLRETDGIEDEYGSHIVCPAKLIREHNQSLRTSPGFRELYMPFDGLLFFGEAGNGDLFGVPLLDGEGRSDVYVWDHEDDSRSWVASDLQQYIDWSLIGRIQR